MVVHYWFMLYNKNMVDVRFLKERDEKENCMLCCTDNAGILDAYNCICSNLDSKANLVS